jgi:uncharacterized C2H2 Zn-finger protein
MRVFMDLKRQADLALLLNRLPPRERTNMEKRVFTCSVCGKVFPTLVEVREHRKKTHGSVKPKDKAGGSVRADDDD